MTDDYETDLWADHINCTLLPALNGAFERILFATKDSTDTTCVAIRLEIENTIRESDGNLVLPKWYKPLLSD